MFLLAIGLFLLVTAASEFWNYFANEQIEWRYRQMIWLRGSDALVPYAIYFLVGAAIGGKGILMARGR